MSGNPSTSSSTPPSAPNGGRVLHTTDSAGNHVDVHYDEDGNVILVEADTDGDGRADTAAAPTADGGSVVATDDDRDGTVDRVVHYDASGDRTRVDPYEDGRLVAQTLDTDGDGRADTLLEDTDRDGSPDTLSVDSNADGRIDAVAVDTDADGRYDTFAVDTDHDGSVDVLGRDLDGDGRIDVFIDEDGAYGSEPSDPYSGGHAHGHDDIDV